MTINFSHLTLHSEFSVTDGIVRLEELFKACQNFGYDSVALTDNNNIYAHVKFYKLAKKYNIKPIFGAKILLISPFSNGVAYPITMLCLNNKGHANLRKIISKTYQHRIDGENPVFRHEWLTKDLLSGIVLLSGGLQGEIGHYLSSNNDNSQKFLEWANDITANKFYISIARIGNEGENNYINASYKFSLQHKVPLVAVNDVQFIKAEDITAHKARVCIDKGLTLDSIRENYTYTKQQYLKKPEEMAELFSDIPEVLENASLIAEACNVSFVFGEVYLPDFAIESTRTLAEEFIYLSELGLAKKFPQGVATEYKQRLKIELDVINGMGFAGYFMIVADFISWSKKNNIPVGPGRGSGAGSLLDYVIGITDIDPLPYDLLFERFLNPERVSMPDFDIDFCMLGRDHVIRYVSEKYGSDSVSQIITYGTMAAKAVVRDVGRVLGYPYGFVDSIAKLIPFEIGMTLSKALVSEEKLFEMQQQDPEVAKLLDLAMSLEGVTRNVGKHAGGVVIAPTPLVDYTALYSESAGESIVSQYDKDDIETIGLVKFDFLGLRTLTIIDWTIQAINSSNNSTDKFDFDNIPLDDKKTFDLLQTAETTGVFQLESRGMKDLIKRLVPDRFEDIVALVALFRPGPLQSGMVDDFIDRKHGRAELEYPHPLTASILEPTYGVILYQEQVMKIAQVLSGYSLGGADLLRRAMGKKKPEEMAKQRDIFIAGAKENDIDNKLAGKIFDLIEKFSGYGFNKSHSVAYALITYRTAYLKAHYPAEFMASVLSSDMDNTDKLCGFLESLKALDLQILPPDLRFSKHEFVVENGNIRYGLGAIKGMGENLNREIVADREKNGEFSDLLDLCVRLDKFKLNRRSLEVLNKSGALDCWGVDRAHIAASIENAFSHAERIIHERSIGQKTLFAQPEVAIQQEKFKYSDNILPMPSSLVYQGEKEALGHYFSGHPFARYTSELKSMDVLSTADLSADLYETVVRISGYVKAVRTLYTKKRQKFAFVTLEDHSGEIDVAVFADLYKEVEEFLLKDQILIIRGNFLPDDYSGQKVIAESLETLSSIRKIHMPHLTLDVTDSCDFVSRLKYELEHNIKGEHKIYINYTNAAGDKAVLDLGEKWLVAIDDRLFDLLEQLPDIKDYAVVY